MIKLFINSTEVQDFDWKDFTVNINRDRDNRVVKITTPQKLTFSGDAYAILNNLLEDSGWCASATVEIQKSCGGGYKTIIEGLIFLTDCEFNKQRCEVDVSMTDNSFYAKVFNNTPVEYYTATELTKNRIQTTAATPININFFYPPDGTYNYGFTHLGTRKCFDFKEVLTKLVKFISDDDLSVVSTWYDNLPDNEKLCIVTGRELRLANGLFHDFRINYGDLTGDVFKFFNLWTSFDGQTLSAEQVDYYFNSTSNFTLDHVKDVKHSALQAEYYSTVKFGTFNATDTAQSFPIQRYTTFEEESYYIDGTCNIINELDLVGEIFICDTNVIEDVLVNDNTSFDDELFLIRYDSSNNNAVATYYSTTTKYFYNELMLNEQVAQRYTFNGALYAMIDSVSDRFRASFPSGTSGIQVGSVGGVPYDFYTFNSWAVKFDFPDFSDDSTAPNYDTDNRFNTSTNVYTAPEDGMYTFSVTLNVNWTSFTFSGTTYYSPWFVIERSVQGDYKEKFTDASGVELIFEGNYAYGYPMYCTLTTYLEAGETVTPKFQTLNEDGYEGDVTYGSWSASGECVFECLSAPAAGGEYKSSGLSDFKTSLFTFEQKLTDQQVTDLLTNTNQAFTFNEDGVLNKKVWIDDITINIKDNFANIQAVSDITNSGE